MARTRTVPVTKACLVCQAEFLVCPPGAKSRYYPPNSKAFCSRTCRCYARYRSARAHAHILTPVDAAYIAGFFDGEGSVILYARRDKVSLRVTFSNTDKRALEWIAHTIGIGSIISKTPSNPNHKVGHTLQCASEAACSLLVQLLPYLHIKVKQAELALAFQKRLQDPAKNADHAWQHEFRAAMQLLNKTGPRDTTITYTPQGGQPPAVHVRL